MSSSSAVKFVAEYAKSGRSSCKKCSKTIAASALRLGLVSKDPRGFDMTKWHHLHCVPFGVSGSACSADTITGFSSLKVFKTDEEGDKPDQGKSKKQKSDAGLRISVKERKGLCCADCESSIQICRKGLCWCRLRIQHPNLQERAVLVQIANPARAKGIHLDAIQVEIEESCNRINKEFGRPGYDPIVFIHQSLSISERMAYYSIAECVVVTAVKDGMNLTPYEYIISRQGITGVGSHLSGIFTLFSWCNFVFTSVSYPS